MTTQATGRPAGTMANKVPEVTVFFWIVKILCTTVGQSFADHVNDTVGFGLTNTTLAFSVALVLTWIVQFRLREYLPAVYWFAVALASVVGTLLTDNLINNRGVSLRTCTIVLAIALLAVLLAWYAKERTLSLHTILTAPREAFYWLTVLLTFALGTALGDWTLELTDWTPGESILLPAGLIGAVLVGWRLGIGPVLSFWLVYVLTQPLGANFGDYLASSRADGGLGLGTLGTSVIFLAAIVVIVIYLTASRRDRPEDPIAARGY